jgi:hypothetical protein
VGTRKDLKPGDFVIEFSRRNERDFSHFALVIGVDHPRDPADGHYGCEERIKVMWSDPPHFDLVCDCAVVLVDTFLADEKVHSG